MLNDLILVNSQNRAVGRADKRTVHEQGLLHRAFSIFLVDGTGRLLLQQRALAKYHSGGLWANSCCGHPRPGEPTRAAAQRRLGEELGAATPLRFGFQARYCTSLPNGMTENEIVYVYFGRAPGTFSLNPAEVAAIDWMSVKELSADIRRRPKRYAYWLRHYMHNHLAQLARGTAAMRDAPAANRRKPKPVA